MAESNCPKQNQHYSLQSFDGRWNYSKTQPSPSQSNPRGICTTRRTTCQQWTQIPSKKMPYIVKGQETSDSPRQQRKRAENPTTEQAAKSTPVHHIILSQSKRNRSYSHDTWARKNPFSMRSSQYRNTFQSPGPSTPTVKISSTPSRGGRYCLLFSL